MTNAQYETAKSLVGSEINELEYIDHIVIENDNYFFQIIHLNGQERMLDIVSHLESVA